jgi:hypothetical protein
MSFLISDHHKYWESNLKKCLSVIPLGNIQNPFYGLIDNRAVHLINMLDKLYGDTLLGLDTDTQLFLNEDWDALIFIINTYFINNLINNKLYYPIASDKRWIKLQTINK